MMAANVRNLKASGMPWRTWAGLVCAVIGMALIELPRYFGNPSMKATVTAMLHRFQMEHYPSPYTFWAWGLSGMFLLATGAFFMLRSARRGDPDIRPSRFYLLMACIVIIGIGFRTIDYVRFPYGLWIDNGMAGLHGLTVLKYREFPIYFHSNYGYEPIIPYLITATIAMIGNTAVAIRLPALIVAILTILAGIRFTRAHFDQLTSLATTLFLSCSLCHIVLSRQGFRCILMPLFAILILDSLLKAFKNPSPLRFAVTGVWLGLSNYSYVAIRFFVFVVALSILHHAWSKRIGFKRLIIVLMQVYIPAGLVVLPLMMYFHQNPHLFSGRAISTVVFNQPHPWQELFHNTRQLLGMFLLAGDLQPRHNVMALPVFNPIEGFLFVVGLFYSVRRFNDNRYAMVLIWMGVMMVPSWITEGAPSFMRLLSMFPAMMLVAGIGFRECAARLTRTTAAAGSMLIAVILFGTLYSGRSIFFDWKQSLETMPESKRSHYGFCEDEHDLSEMFINDPEKEFVVSPQVFLHPSVQFLCYGKKGLILISDPMDIESYVRGKDSVVFVYSDVERNLWWLRDSREKDFFAWQKREYGISQAEIWDVLRNHYGTHLPVMAADYHLGNRLREIYPLAERHRLGVFTIVRIRQANH